MQRVKRASGSHHRVLLVQLVELPLFLLLFFERYQEGRHGVHERWHETFRNLQILRSGTNHRVLLLLLRQCGVVSSRDVSRCKNGKPLTREDLREGDSRDGRWELEQGGRLLQ